MSGLTNPDEARARLDAVRAKRGYLLPHHGLLAVTAPALLEAYDRAYTELTLAPRMLDQHAKEFVWLGILVATEEALATHHIAKFRAAGGSDAEIEAAVRLAGCAAGAPAFAFAAEHWGRHLPSFDRARAYRDAVALAASGTAPRLVEMIMAAIHTCRRRWWELALHIKGAYQAGVSEVELAEALSYTMFPGSVPNFVDACGVWQRLVLQGEVPASETIRLWAQMEQDGFG